MRLTWALGMGLLATVAHAADTGLLLGGVSGGGAAYVGPGDVVSGATAWYGLRGYSAASAAPGTGKAVQIRRASDSATQDIVIGSNGRFDIAGYNAFVGTDATGSCTIASTTLTCSGLGSTLNVADPITGSGIGNPCYLTAVGAFAGGSQTATINSAAICGSVGVAVTVTAQVAGFIAKLYDQTLGGLDLVQTTPGNQPQLLPFALGSGPAILFTASTQALATTSSPTPASATPSFSAVASRVSGTGLCRFPLQNGNANRLTTLNTGANTWSLIGGGGGGINATASDAAFHAAQGIINGASSALVIDNSSTAGTATGNTVAASIAVQLSTAANVCEVLETGIWGATIFSGGQATALNSNEHAFWAF